MHILFSIFAPQGSEGCDKSIVVSIGSVGVEPIIRNVQHLARGGGLSDTNCDIRIYTG